MADDVVVFHKKDLPLEAYPLMEEIRRRGKLCDVTLKVGDQKFSCHRIVLAATIPYFHAMFTHDMVESKQDEITMQGIEASALEALINYAYNGKIQLDTTTVQSILVAACFLHLHIIKEACCDFLRNRLHANNVLGVRSFADQFMCGNLVSACNSYIQKHFLEVTKSEEFLALSADEVLAIISQDELCVDNEEMVFEAVMRWVKIDESAHIDHLPNLLRHVRLPLLSPVYLADVVSQEQLIKTSLKCRDLIDEAKDYHLIPERRNQLQTFRRRPRCHTGIIGIMYAVGGLTSSGDSISTVEFYDPIVGQWHVDEPMSTFRSRVGIAVLKNDLYAIGGYDGQERLNTVEVFNIKTKKWKLVSPMLCRRSALGAAALDDKLYVCGGYDGVSSLNSVECYNPALDKWTMEKSMSKHRSAAGVTLFDGHIFCLGGHDGLSIFDTVERYSVITSQWSMVAPMLTKRCRLGVAALDGKLYAAGGYDGNVFLKSVEQYDPVTNKWSFVAPMNVKRSRVALIANCGKLYAIGGYDGASNLNSVEVYDSKENKWSFAAHMRAHEGGVGVGVLPLEALEDV